MLRFAPTPNGDMHIGDLQVALFNYVVAKQKQEDFIVRIEDIDKEKNTDKKDTEILDILALFGIEYSQVINQSQNIRFHTAMALQLMHEKKAFSCFCSDEWLGKKHQEAKEANKTYKYDDACRNLPPELVIDNTNPFSIRIVRPDGDLDADAVDSFIIMNQDKTPTYDFACAVDDMLSDISLVIRNKNYLDNTPKQEHVRDMLGYDKKIEYVHLPFIQEEVSVKELLEDGYLPSAISNYLISTNHKIFNMQDAIKDFNLDDISDSPTRFSLDALKEINKEHLKQLDAVELSRYVGFADADIGELAKVYLEDVSTTKELKTKIKPIFEPKQISKEYEESALVITKSVKDAPYFEKYDDFKRYIMDKTKLNEDEFCKTFRYLLTGLDSGPDMQEIYRCLKNYIGEIIK